MAEFRARAMHAAFANSSNRNAATNNSSSSSSSSTKQAMQTAYADTLVSTFITFIQEEAGDVAAYCDLLRGIKHESPQIMCLLDAMIACLRARQPGTPAEGVLADLLYRKRCCPTDVNHYDLTWFLTPEVYQSILAKAVPGNPNAELVRIFTCSPTEYELQRELVRISDRLADAGHGATGLEPIFEEEYSDIWQTVGARLYGDACEDPLWRTLTSSFTGDNERVHATVALMMFLLYFEGLQNPSAAAATATHALPVSLPAPAPVAAVSATVPAVAVPTVSPEGLLAVEKWAQNRLQSAATAASSPAEAPPLPDAEPAVEMDTDHHLETTGIMSTSEPQTAETMAAL